MKSRTIMISFNGGEPEPFTIPKPKIKWLEDDYAKETGKLWCCSFGGCCARGETPEEAYNELDEYFKRLRSLDPTRPFQQNPRA